MMIYGISFSKKYRINLVFMIVICTNAVLTAGLTTRTEAEVRVPVDTVGYATSPSQIEAVVEYADSFITAAPDLPKDTPPGGSIIGGICPHDDYLYAGIFYTLLMEELKAPMVVLIGVSHHARHEGIQDKLIFDDFDSWKGPYGKCLVSPLRQSIISDLPPDLVMVSNSMHAAEHSLEAFIPFLQYMHHKRRWHHPTDTEDNGIRILPILVTRLRGELFINTADTLSEVLHSTFNREGLELGKDVVILISADCVHYGDEKWGNRNYAPFGVGEEGYHKAAEQDVDIVETTLTGEISDGKISMFRNRVERDALDWPYEITWCGVYSIPFGLSVMANLCDLAGREHPRGYFLGYGTSLAPGKMPLEKTGLGVTNISTLRHWVGYTAVGYW